MSVKIFLNLAQVSLRSSVKQLVSSVMFFNFIKRFVSNGILSNQKLYHSSKLAMVAIWTWIGKLWIPLPAEINKRLWFLKYRFQFQNVRLTGFRFGFYLVEVQLVAYWFLMLFWVSNRYQNHLILLQPDSECSDSWKSKSNSDFLFCEINYCKFQFYVGTSWQNQFVQDVFRDHFQ